MKPGEHLYPAEGLHIWKNEKNGFVVFELHYKADPGKRDPTYIKEIKNAMPSRQFKQEYELQWDSFEGLPVYADWDSSIHGLKTTVVPHIGMPLLMGLDFGLTPAAIICQMQEDVLYVIKEFTAFNMGAQRFFTWLTPQLKIMYPSWVDFEKDWICFIDPSGMYRKDTDESSCLEIIKDFGFTNIVPGPERWEERKAPVETLLTRRTRHGMALQVSMPGCPILTKGFQGGYRYEEKVLDNEPAKLRPKKDIHSHIQDALQYVCSRILSTKRPTNVRVPRLHYSWSSD